MKPIPYGRHWIDDDDIAEVVKVLQSDWLTTGPKVKEFEEKFAAKVDAKYAVAVANGTAALHIAYLAAGISRGDEVITTPMTFSATANCALFVGAKPVFADIDPVTYNINPVEIRKKITPITKAIIPVHYMGLPCDMSEIHNIAKENNLMVIEDACHALGSRYKNHKTGDCSFSDMTVFSFHPVKHITTGEGGMVTTNSLLLYEKLIMLRNHGINRDVTKCNNEGNWYYEIEAPSHNYRITDIQCALGISQLKKLDLFVEKRREIADIYKEGLKDLPVILPKEPKDYFHSYHLFVINIEKAIRKKLYDILYEAGIYCQVHYIPLHFFYYYRKKLGYKEGDFPHAEKYYQNALSIPIFPKMAVEEIEYVLKKIKQNVTP